MRTLPLLSLPFLLCIPPVLHAQDGKPAPDAAQRSDADRRSKKDNDKPLNPAQIHNPTLWHDPGDISQLDLFYGAGGKDKQPTPPFKFTDEDMNGTNPKMNADDANGKSWRIKLGPEARPEVAASRLLWAMGFYVNDDYLLPQAEVSGINMKRGKKLIDGDHITDARFARKPPKQKKIGIWEWKHNPFSGSRELNGLRVMMALMNSWDLKDVNNAVYFDSENDKQIFLVSDIGATFASTTLKLPIASSKGDIQNFEKSKFITKQDDKTVSFANPSAPTGIMFETFGANTAEFVKRKGYEWIGRDIPVADARWMASLLGRLSHQQIHDAFRAANFPPEEVDAYTTVIESRIARLQDL